MTADRRPAPQRDDLTARFWEGVANGTVTIQKCSACGAVRHPPAVMCEYCGSTDVAHVESSGKGRIYSLTRVHVARHVGFADRVPFTAALVELEDNPGVFLACNLPRHRFDELAIGSPVEMYADQVQSVPVAEFRLRTTSQP